jgi:multidrug transporter EmrE-like cation transporter
VTARGRRLVRLAPWPVAAALLALVFWRVDPEATLGAFAAADWKRFVLAALPFAGLWLLIDAAALSRLVSRFHAPVGFHTMLRLRGGSYLFLVLSYDAAQAALALALHRRLGVPLVALGGTFLFYYAIDLLTIAGLGLGGASALPGVRGEALRAALAVLLAAVLGGLALFGALGRRMRLRAAAELVGWRALFYASFVGFAAATLPAFGIRVPLRALVACVPVTLSLAALPITISGIGSAQVAMLALYGAFAEPPAIVAYSLAHTASLIVLRLPIGLFFWPAIAGVAGRPEVQVRTELARRSGT